MEQPAYLSEARHGTPNSLRILVVDDNIDAASTMSMFFAELGHHVTVAHHPVAALLKAEEQDFDFFLLDIGLPDMDGYELAKNLQNRVKSRRVTFAAYTAYGGDAYRDKSYAVGFAHHFVKPGEVDEIMAALESALVYSRSGE